MNAISLPGLSSASIAERYRQGDPLVRSLFGSHPADEADWRLRADDVDSSSALRAERERLVAAIRSYHARLPAHPAVDGSLSRLARPDALTVVGGQQAGLFGGALLILYKAVSVIRTARYAERLLGRPVVPVFWVAGEDHDYDEANHVYVASAQGELRKIRIGRPEGPRRAVSRTPLTEDAWRAALDELAALLPDSSHKPDLVRRLQTFAEDSPSLTLSFARQLADLFGPEGLLILDADDPEIRALEGAFFAELIERNDELTASLLEGEARVRELGLPIQAEVVPESAQLFVHHEDGRLLLYKQEGTFADRKGRAVYPASALRELALTSPDRLSTGALARPLMQERLLPVLATVLGPAEIAYWALLGGAFERFGLRMPLIVPRTSYTYLESSVHKAMERFGLSLEDALHRWEERRAAWLAGLGDETLAAQFRLAKAGFDALYAPLLEAITARQPGLAPLGEANRRRILEQIDYLEKRTLDAAAARHEADLRLWEMMRISLQPLGKPQERVLGGIHFLNRYGPEWLAGWMSAPFAVTGGHWLLEG